MSLISAIERVQSVDAYTENGAPTFSSTLNKNLDMFGIFSAKRSNPDEALGLFMSAYGEDPKLAVLNLFYSRDIRQGQGEREIFRRCIDEYFKTNHYSLGILELIPEYGRWDDLINLVLHENQEVVKKVCEIIRRQLNQDIIDSHPSLMSKWIPLPNSVNSKFRKKVAWKLLELLDGDTRPEKQRLWRKLIVMLRKKIILTERLMSEGKWDQIPYEKITSRSFKKNYGAFLRHDQERFEEFISGVKKGEKKINASCVYPHEIICDVRDEAQNENVLEEIWKNIPNIDINGSILTMVDVSGSMLCTVGNTRANAMDISIGLGLYTAERCKGPFKDYIISFHSEPKLIHVPPTMTLKQRIKKIMNEGMGFDTNIQKAFELVLKAAVEHGVPENEMPDSILIISDMEFNQIEDNPYYGVAETNYEYIKKIYSDAGVKLPQLVFWNVAARGNNLPVQKDENGTILVSGFSINTLKLICQGCTPEQFMLDVLYSDRYRPVLEALAA